MLNNKTVAVIVPAFNEEKQIGMVIDTMPEFVDRIVVVDDHSIDETVEIVLSRCKTMGKLTIPIKKSLQVNNKYAWAEHVLEKQNAEELKYFPEADVIQEDKDHRLVLISFKKNQGKGMATARGYKWAKDQDIDCIAVVDGDGQMEPFELK